MKSVDAIELMIYVHFVNILNKNIPYSHFLLNDDKNKFPAKFPGNFDILFWHFFV